MAKRIAIYGVYETKVNVKQRYHKWIYKNGKKWYKRRVWKKTRRLKKVERSGRYEFWGKGKDLYKAVKKAHEYMPKGYITVQAEKFVENPEKYGFEGEWVEREVES